jgi:hypothetical protein
MRAVAVGAKLQSTGGVGWLALANPGLDEINGRTDL